MRKSFFYLLIFAFFFSCTQKEEPNVLLFNDITFKLKDKEKVVDIDSELKDDFHSYFMDLPTQVPLFRCIEGNGYFIYLGIPFNTNVKKLSDLKLSQINNHSNFERDSTYFYINHKKENQYIAEYAKAFENNQVYVLAVSVSPEKIESDFNKEAILKRFNEK